MQLLEPLLSNATTTLDRSKVTINMDLLQVGLDVISKEEGWRCELEDQRLTSFPPFFVFASFSTNPGPAPHQIPSGQQHYGKTKKGGNEVSL